MKQISRSHFIYLLLVRLELQTRVKSILHFTVLDEFESAYHQGAYAMYLTRGGVYALDTFKHALQVKSPVI